jgi:hypothetical protein
MILVGGYGIYSALTLAKTSLLNYRGITIFILDIILWSYILSLGILKRYDSIYSPGGIFFRKKETL